MHELHKQQKGFYSLFLECLLFKQIHHLFLEVFALIEKLTDINTGVILHMVTDIGVLGGGPWPPLGKIS